MELVNLTKDEIKKEIKLKSEKEVDNYTFITLDLIRSFSKMFENYDIPITINLEFQENNQKAEVYQEFYHSLDCDAHLNQEIPQ